ncbi:MAG TPA: sulfite exporter TauE/SafE family protein [Enhygromyxa sp.]|nr:sulfite exporter TauE/SafE family protein [Enhygromyxa sp.]
MLLACSVLAPSLPELGGVSLLGDPWLDASLLLIVGVIAGVINTMAGGGSLLVLPILIGLGLPAGVANGSSRLAAATQSAAAAATLHRRGVRAHQLSARLAGPMIGGALLGSWLVTLLDDWLFRVLLGVMLLAWAVILLVQPDRFLRPPDEQREPNATSYVLAVAVGIYGGALQAAVGFLLIALLSGQLGYDLVRANSVKVTLVLAYTLVVLPVFVLADQVAWLPAIVLAIGTVVGAWAGARWQLEKGSAVVRWFVLVMVLISGLAMLWPIVAGWLG